MQIKRSFRLYYGHLYVTDFVCGCSENTRSWSIRVKQRFIFLGILNDIHHLHNLFLMIIVVFRLKDYFWIPKHCTVVNYVQPTEIFLTIAADRCICNGIPTRTYHLPMTCHTSRRREWKVSPKRMWVCWVCAV